MTVEKNKSSTTPISMATASEKTGRAASGMGMDRVVEKKKQPWKIAGIAAAVLVGVYFIGTMVLDAQGGRSFKIDESRVVISAVSEGTFEDFIPVRGRVTPLKTLFLDAIEGGRVERILVEDGTTLNQGDLHGRPR